MAQPRRQPPPEPKPSSAAPEVAATLGVAGTTAGAAAPAAAGVAGVALTAAAVRQATSRIMASINRFARRRQAQIIEELAPRLLREFPERTPDEIAELVRQEAKREIVFRRKQRERLQRDLPQALQQSDPAKRVEAVQGILTRERRYLGQREEAMAERAYTAAEMIDLQKVSPQGAFWKLSEAVQEHTPGCLAMGNKFWPWSVLKVVHPQLHAGCACHLYSLDEAVERGFMFPDQVPDPADAKRRADAIIERIKDVYESATEDEIAAYLEELAEEQAEIEEAALPGASMARRGFYGTKPGERFGRGHSKGGEFKPRRGGRPGTIRGVARKALRALIPEVPRLPLQARYDHEGTWMWLRGRYVFVPSHREFRRKLDGVEFHSPPGSGNVYRNGYLIHVPGEAQPHHGDLDRPDSPDLRNIPSTPEYSEAIPTEREAQIDAAAALVYNAAREKIDARVKEALATQSTSAYPVETGDLTAAMTGALKDNGFFLAELQQINRPDLDEEKMVPAATFRHSSGAEVTLISHEGRVRDHFWTAATEAEIPPELGDTPPESWGDFVSDLTAVAHESAAELGRVPELVSIQVGKAERYRDHCSSWQHGGYINLGRDVPDGIAAIATAKAEGRKLTPHEAGEVWMSYSNGVHESLHAAHPISVHDYGEPALKAMEEALNEEYSRVVTARVLKRLNLPEALQFQRDRYDSPRARGCYLYYRKALDDVLTVAKVAPEEREDYIKRLRFEVPPSRREFDIAKRIVSVASEDHYPQFMAREDRSEADVLMDAAYFVHGTMLKSDEDQSTYKAEPILHVPLEDVPHEQPYLVNGKPLKTNGRVRIDKDGVISEGRVASIFPIEHVGPGVPPFVFGVVTDDFDFIDSVVPREIVEVLTEPNDVLRLPDDTEVREGDLILYNNRADGGRSEAVVEQIVRAGGYRGNLPAPHRWDDNDWVVFARTTENSLKSDQEIVLTLDRTGNFVGRGDIQRPEQGEGGQVIQFPTQGRLALAASGRTPYESNLPELRAELSALADNPLPTLEWTVRRSELRNAIKAERARLDADTETLRAGDPVQIKEIMGDFSQGRVVKTNKQSLDVELHGIVRRYEKSSRSDDGSWSDSIGRPVKRSTRLSSEGPVTSVRISPGLFDELWMLERDAADGSDPDQDAFADEMDAAWERQGRTRGKPVTLNLTPALASYLDHALDNADDIWADKMDSADAGERARNNSYRRAGRKVREQVQPLRSEGFDPTAELAAMRAGDHPRIYLNPVEESTGTEWSDAEKLQVAGQISAAMDDYERLIQDDRFRRVLRWSGDASYAESLTNYGPDFSRPRRVNLYLRRDDEEKYDGWGVTDIGGGIARVDTRRPGVNFIDSPREEAALGSWYLDARYTAMHEAHHMYGSSSEFDFGSDVAFAWHTHQRGINGNAKDAQNRVADMIVTQGPNSRLSRSLRALFGDDTLDEWGTRSGWRDVLGRRPEPPVDYSIEGRVEELNSLVEGDRAAKIAWLEGKNMADVSEFYSDRLGPGERAFMRANGETLVLDTQGTARVLESLTTLDTEGIQGLFRTDRDVRFERGLPRDEALRAAALDPDGARFDSQVYRVPAVLPSGFHTAYIADIYRDSPRRRQDARYVALLRPPMPQGVGPQREPLYSAVRPVEYGELADAPVRSGALTEIERPKLRRATEADGPDAVAVADNGWKLMRVWADPETRATEAGHEWETPDGARLPAIPRGRSFGAREWELARLIARRQGVGWDIGIPPARGTELWSGEIEREFPLDPLLREMGAFDMDTWPERRPDLYDPPRKLAGGGFATPRNQQPKPNVMHDRVGQPPRIRDTVPAQGFLPTETPVEGSERSPEFLFRAISEEEWEGIQKNGYMQSDQRMNLADEGTVAAFSDPSFYLPGKLASSPVGDHPGRIIRIRYRDEDGWLYDSDGYVKTHGRVPRDQIDYVSPQIIVRKSVRGENGLVDFETIIGEDVGTETRAPQTIRLYHGTTNLALERGGDELRARSMEELAAEVEDDFGLERGSVYNHAWFEFERYRKDEGLVWLSSNPRVAESYASRGGEALEGALRTVWRIQHPGDDTPYPSDRLPEWVEFKEDYLRRKGIEPVVLPLDVPIEEVPVPRGLTTLTVDEWRAMLPDLQGDHGVERVSLEWQADEEVRSGEGPYYHGTAASFEKFDVSRTGTIATSDWGEGIYLTPSKAQADRYREDAVVLTDPEATAAFAEWERLEKGTQTVNGVPQYSDEANAALKRFQQISRRAREDTTVGRVMELRISPDAKIAAHYIEPGSLTDPFLAQTMKNKGYDAIKIYDRLREDDGVVDRLSEIIVMNPDVLIQPEPVRAEGPTDMWDAVADKLGFEMVEAEMGLGRSVRYRKGDQQFWLSGFETRERMRVTHIITQPERSGIGSQMIEALRERADATGQELHFELVLPATVPFMDRFEWLERRQPEGRTSVDYVYTPTLIRSEGATAIWDKAIPDEPPKFKAIGPGVYDSEDGRITMYRIEGVRPPAWNIEWHTDYLNAVDRSGSREAYSREFSTNIVDGAASMKDAKEFYAEAWPHTRATMVSAEEFKVTPAWVEVTLPGRGFKVAKELVGPSDRFLLDDATEQRAGEGRRYTVRLPYATAKRLRERLDAFHREHLSSDRRSDARAAGDASVALGRVLGEDEAVWSEGVGNPASMVRPDFREIEPEPGPDVGIHSTGGHGAAETLRDQTTSSGTGFFGSGFYFVSDQTKLRGYTYGDDNAERRVVGIDLTGKRLFRPWDEDAAFKLHDWLADVNYLQHTDDDLDAPKRTFHDPELQKLYGTSVAESLASAAPVSLRVSSQALKRAILGARADLERDPRSTRDSASTRLLRSLGYDGIDVRGLGERIDNTGYGSVLYRDPVLPEPIQVEHEAAAREVPEAPRKRLTRAHMDALMLADQPDKRGPVTDQMREWIEGVTYTPKLKRKVTALDFGNRGEMWVSSEFFELGPHERNNVLAKEFANQLATLAKGEMWFNDRNAWGEHGDKPADAIMFAYSEAYYDTDDRDWDFLGTEGGRATVELAMRQGFPVAPDVEAWAKKQVPATGEPGVPPPKAEPVSLAEGIQTLLESVRKTNNANFAHNILSGKMASIGKEFDLGFTQTEYRRETEDGLEDGVDTAVYRNYDSGTVITVTSRGDDLVNIEAIQTDVNLPKNPQPGTPEHDARAVVGVPFEEAQTILSERGYYAQRPEWGYPSGWRRFTNPDGLSILVKPSSRGYKKVSAAYPDAASAEHVEEAQSQARARDPLAGYRIGQPFDMGETFNLPGLEGWRFVEVEGGVAEYRHPEHGSLRIVTSQDKVSGVGRPDPGDPRGVLSDEDYQQALQSVRAELDPLQRLADELKGLTRKQVYEREQFQSHADLEGGYFDNVDGPRSGEGSTVWKNHDTGETLVLEFDSGDFVVGGSSYQRDYPRGKGEASGGDGPAEVLADEWRTELHEPDVTARVFMDSMKERGYEEIGSEGKGWTRYTHGQTGESIVAKFEGGRSWDTAILTAVYNDETGERARWRARGKWLMIDPLTRIQVGDEGEEVGAAVVGGGAGSSWRRYEGGADSPSGSLRTYVRYAEFTKPDGGSKIRMRFEQGKVAQVGYAGSETPTTILTQSEFDERERARVEGIEQAEANREQVEREDFERRQALIAAREAPVEVGEPGNEVVSLMKSKHDFQLRSRKRVRYTKKEWEAKAEAEDRIIGSGRPPFKGYSYVLRDSNGHTLALQVEGNTPAGATFLGMPVSSSSAVTKVTWTPAPVRDRRRLSSPPTTEDELVEDALGRVDELADRYGTKGAVPHIITRSSKRDHSGHHEFNGTIVLGADCWPDMKRAMEKIGRGEPLTGQECADAYSAWETLQHEVNHGVNTQNPGGGETPHVGFEEALVEELAHPMTVEWLRSLGMEEIVSWAKAHPDNAAVQGVYLHHRRRFKELLDEAQVPEEARRDLMYRLKFSMDSLERIDHMAGLLAAATGMDEDAARIQVRSRMSYRKRVDKLQPLTPGENWERILSLDPDWEGVPAQRLEVEVGNGTITVGQRVGLPLDHRSIASVGHEIGWVQAISLDGESVYVNRSGGSAASHGLGQGEWMARDLVFIPPLRVASGNEVEIGDEVFTETPDGGEIGEIVELTEFSARIKLAEGGEMWSPNDTIYRTDTPVVSETDSMTGSPLEVDGEFVLYGTVFEGIPHESSEFYRKTGDNPVRFWAVGGWPTGHDIHSYQQNVMGLVSSGDGRIRVPFPLHNVRRISQTAAA